MEESGIKIRLGQEEITVQFETFLCGVLGR